MTQRKRRLRHGDEDLDALCDMARDVLECDAVVVAVWQSDGAGVGAAGIDRPDARSLAELFHPDASAAAGRLAAHGAAGERPAASRSAHDVAVEQTTTRTLLARFGFASAVRSALTLHGEISGLMFALSRVERDLDVALVRALVRSCESILELGRDAAMASAPPEIDSLALHAESFPTLMPAIRRVASAALGQVSVGLSVHDEESGLLLTAAGSFALPVSVTASYSIDPNDLHSNAARVFELQRPFASNQVIGDPAILQSYPIAFGIDSMIALPLIVAGRSTGVLMIANKPGGFHPDDVDGAAALTPQIAIAVELARLNEAKRFRYSCEHTLAELSAAVAEPIVDVDRLRPAMRELAQSVRVERLEIVGERGTLLQVDARLHPAAAESEARIAEFPCGARDGDSLRLRLSPAHSGGFLRGERRLVQDAAGLLAEAFARTQALRHEVELLQHRERRRIADDLHDDVSQLLFAAQLALDSVARGDERAEEAAVRAGDLVRRAEVALRDSIFVLHTPRHALSEALTDMVASMRREWNVTVKLTVDPVADPFVAPEVAHVLVRGAREALHNIAKHAGPCTAAVSAGLVDANDRRVRIDVEDDGCGADFSQSHGHGLRSLRRRVGELGGSVSVASRPGSGTQVSIQMPLASGASDAG